MGRVGGMPIGSRQVRKGETVGVASSNEKPSHYCRPRVSTSCDLRLAGTSLRIPVQHPRPLGHRMAQMDPFSRPVLPDRRILFHSTGGALGFYAKRSPPPLCSFWFRLPFFGSSFRSSFNKLFMSPGLFSAILKLFQLITFEDLNIQQFTDFLIRQYEQNPECRGRNWSLELGNYSQTNADPLCQQGK